MANLNQPRRVEYPGSMAWWGGWPELENKSINQMFAVGQVNAGSLWWGTAKKDQPCLGGDGNITPAPEQGGQ